MLQLSVLGNLGRDATLEQGNRGKYISFSVAHSSRFKNQQGQEVTETTWVSCILDGSHDRLLPFLTKGTKVFCQGNMAVRLFRDRTGQFQCGVNLNVRVIELAGSGSSIPQQQQQAEPARQPYAGAALPPEAAVGLGMQPQPLPDTSNDALPF